MNTPHPSKAEAQELEPTASTSSVAPVHLRPILDELKQLGLDSESLFRGLGFGATDLDIPGFLVTQHEAATVVRRALLLIGNPNLGLELGMRSKITNLGALALGLMASGTLADGVQLAMRFPRSAGFMLSIHEDHSKDNHELIAEPLFDNHDIAPFLVDKLFAGMVRQRRYLAGADYVPAFVELVRQRPANAKAYEHYFKSPVRFGSLRNRLVSDLAHLRRPLPLANAMSFRLACELLEKEAALATGLSSIRLAVERVIRKSLPKVPTPANVATSLNISERSLRRKLAAEGISYSSLLDEGRKSRAMELVVNGRRPLAEVAVAVGFADVRNFRRAFKRWTGQAPSVLRDGLPPDAQAP